MLLAEVKKAFKGGREAAERILVPAGFKQPHATLQRTSRERHKIYREMLMQCKSCPAIKDKYKSVQIILDRKDSNHHVDQARKKSQ